MREREKSPKHWEIVLKSHTHTHTHQKCGANIETLVMHIVNVLSVGILHRL